MMWNVLTMLHDKQYILMTVVKSSLLCHESWAFNKFVHQSNILNIIMENLILKLQYH